jgi:hypothetical protein
MLPSESNPFLCVAILILFISVLLVACGDEDPAAAGAINNPPIAEAPVTAGPDKTTPVNQPVTIEGAAPAGKPVTYTIVDKPANSSPQLDIQDDGTAVIVTDQPGTYTVEVTTPDGSTPPDTVLVVAEEHVITLQFSGTLTAAGGTVTGTFAYDSGLQPHTTNVRNLAPNALYELRDWHIVVDGGATGVESTTYSKDDPGNTGDFCVGLCIVSPTQALELRFTNGSDRTLQIVYTKLYEGLELPNNLASWGPFRFTTYRTQTRVAVNDVAADLSVAEPVAVAISP